MRLHTEATKAETEAAKERMRLHAEAEKLKYEAEKERRDQNKIKYLLTNN